MKDEKVFGRIGLNLDDDPRYFGVNDTDLIQNMLPNVTGDAGLEETHPGNIEIPSAFVYGGGVKVIGTCRDAKTNYIYLFVKADDPLVDGNSILQYDPISETYRKIVFEEISLLMGDFVYGAVVFGDYIIYNTLTDGLRKVHIDYANRFYNIDLWAAGVYQDGDLVRRPDGSCYVCLLDTVIGDGAPELEPTHWAFEYYTYPEVRPTTFVLRNMPPVNRPTITYGTDATRAINNLTARTFQFAYRYKYIDGGYSVYSEYSDIALPQNVELWDGGESGLLYANNVITVGFIHPGLALVQYIEIIVREGNVGNWKLFRTIRDDVSTVAFYNDEKYESVDQDSVAMLEDAIPRSCADMTLINENRIVVARPTEGFDNVDIDVSMWPSLEVVAISNTPPVATIGDTIVIVPFVGGVAQGSALNTSDIDISDGYAVGDYMVLTGSVNGVPFAVNYILQAGDIGSKANLISAIQYQIIWILNDYYNVVILQNLIVDDPYGPSSWNSGVSTKDIDDIEIRYNLATDYISGSIQFLDMTVAAPALNKWNTYKSGSVYPHGIEYFDAEFRHSTVMTSSGSSAYIPSRGMVGSDLNYRVRLEWTIAHIAPSWAAYWRWTSAGNSTQSSYVQYVISGVNSTMAAPYDGYIGLDITPLQELKTDLAPDVSIPGSIIDPYVFVEGSGDRVRILTEAGAGALGYGPVCRNDAYYDLPVKGLSGAYLLVPKPPSGTYGAGIGSLIEIYTPRTFIDDSEQYFPVADIYPVLAGGYHSAKQRADIAITGTADNGVGRVRVTTATPHGLTGGDWVKITGTVNYNRTLQVGTIIDGTSFDLNMSVVAPSQTGVLSPLAFGVLESGDAWLIGRAFSENIGTVTSGTMLAVESMNYSDFYLSAVWDKGKPNTYLDIGEVTQNNIRYGLKHLTGASVNNMFTFDALDYKTTTEIYGDLERIGECGDILRLIFNKRVASMYIGKTEYMDTEGSSIVATSTNVLSNPNYSIDDFGTTVPEAVLFVGGIAYFIDLYNGAIIRSTNNGSFPISGRVEASEEGAQYKMSSYFRNICNQVLDAQLLIQGGTTDGNTLRMLMGWDNERKLLYVSILQENIENRTLVFSEDRGRWVAFLDLKNIASGYFPTAYEWASGKFLSFLDGSDAVWDHSSPSSTALSIYGEAKTATISSWCVVHPNKTKVYDSIAIHTDATGWYGSIFIPPSLSYPVGMESRLLATNFVRRENALYASYMFNGLSAGSTFSVLGLYNGESLRGSVIENRLSITTAAKLFKVDVNYRVSNL